MGYTALSRHRDEAHFAGAEFVFLDRPYTDFDYRSDLSQPVGRGADGVDYQAVFT